MQPPYDAFCEQDAPSPSNPAQGILRATVHYAYELPAEALLRRLLPISSNEVLCDVRGFDCSRPSQRQRLEQIGATFLTGYHAALRNPIARLERRLDQVDLELRGFACEGAAMALGLLDALLPLQRRLVAWIAGPGNRHTYMSMVGLGWAFARLPWRRRRIETVMADFEPLLWPLVLDGFGFHEGYFHPASVLKSERYPVPLSPEGRRAFDQGLGRSLWFSQGASPEAIGAVIRSRAPDRSSDLWSGVGLACAYAGWLTKSEALRLRDVAGPHRAALAQGVAFAAKARDRAGNPAEQTAVACQILCGVSAKTAAIAADEALIDIGRPPNVTLYREWVLLLRNRFEEA